MMAKHFPSVHIFVQVSDMEAQANGLQNHWNLSADQQHQQQQQQQQTIIEGRVTLQQRSMGAPQPVRDALVYVLHLNSLTSGTSSSAAALDRIRSELVPMVDVLRSNPSATLVLTSGLIPVLGSVSARVEARARLRDMMLFQLTNQNDVEVSEIVKMLGAMTDDRGRLALVNKNCSPRSGDLALEIKYQTFAHG